MTVIDQRLAGRNVVGKAQEVVAGRRGAVAVGLGQEMDSLGDNGDFGLAAGPDGDGVVGDGRRDLSGIVDDDVEAGRVVAALHVLVLFGVENEAQSVGGARAVDPFGHFWIPIEGVAESEVGEGFGKVQTATGHAVPVAAQHRVRDVVTQLLQYLLHGSLGGVVASGELVIGESQWILVASSIAHH